MFIYGFLYQNYGGVGNPTTWLGFCYVGTLRAIAGISLGAFSWYAASILKLKSLSKLTRYSLTIIEIFLYILAIFMMQKVGLHHKEFFVILILFIAVSVAGSSNHIASCFRKGNNIQFLGKFSLAIYLCHGRFPGFFCRILPSSFPIEYKFAIYIATVFFVSYICMRLCMYLKKF